MKRTTLETRKPLRATVADLKEFPRNGVSVNSKEDIRHSASIGKSTRRPFAVSVSLERARSRTAAAKQGQARKTTASKEPVGPEQPLEGRDRSPSKKRCAKASVSIIIPVFNQAALTAQCVQSL